MDEATLGELMRAMSEDFSYDELEDTPRMLRSMYALLGLEDHDAMLVLVGARTLSRLSEGRTPNWRRLLEIQ